MPTLSVVVVTWNAKKYVDLCLRSLANIKDISAEVIVVDNASTDGTPELISECFPEFRLIRNETNLGFSKANNIGIREARGTFICLVNSDVIVPEGCFRILADFLRAEPSVGMVGPQMIAPNGSISRSAMRFPSLRSAIARALSLDHKPSISRMLKCQLMADFPHDVTQDVDILNGWFWMIRREALDEVGLLDEQFFMYGEDMDWCMRFGQHGWRRVFLSSTRAVHFGAGSSSAMPIRFYVEQQRADFQYWKKHSTLPSLLGYRLTVLAHNALRIVGYSIVYVFDPGKRSSSSLKVRRSLAVWRWMLSRASVPRLSENSVNPLIKLEVEEHTR